MALRYRERAHRAPPPSRTAGAAVLTLALAAVSAGSALGCNQRDPGEARGLVLNEVMSDNEGACVDELGEADDYIELVNASDSPVNTARFALRDDDGNRAALPSRVLAPGAALLLFADGSPEQGPAHLPFKLSASGERLTLEDLTGRVLDVIDIPALAIDHAYARAPHATGAFEVCRYATPGRDNGAACGPPAPPELGDDVHFSEFEWPDPWPDAEGPLVLSELALHPAGFIEVLNVSDEPVALSEFLLHLAPHGPGQPWPGLESGARIGWPESAVLEPGERLAATLSDTAVEEIASDPLFEGVVTLFERATDRPVDRIDFERWPEGAALTRVPDASGHPRFCAAHTPGEPNDECDPLASREVGDRVRHLYTPGDFAALGDGDTSLNVRGVKFVVDMANGDVVHLLGNRAYSLHYEFAREHLYGEPPLDRCDSEQAAVFYAGWVAFSQREYFRADGRTLLLGTLNHHAGSDMHTVDFTYGDAISSEQILRAFFTVMRHVDEPWRWALRPTDPNQVPRMQAIDGQAPIVGQNAPFQGVSYQPLTEAVGFGVLRFIPVAELEQAALGRDVIVVTDDVPNDIPLVGGLITEAFQTPLAHVNVLSRNRGTPNMALAGAREDPALAPLFDELVRLQVSASGFDVRRASAEEAEAFWAMRDPGGERVAPRRDLTVRGVQPLEGMSLDDLPAIGAKAAQFAELGAVTSNCGGETGVPTPVHAFAIPLAHYADHFERSGAQALLDDLLDDPEFRADPEARAAGLAALREAILTADVDADLLAELTDAVRARFGERRVRLRSSSNTEDLPEFNGAGLYTSISIELDDPERRLDDGLRTVWASLWSLRAYDERELARIDQTQVAMGVLVHEAFLSERANAVAISRNLLDPTRSDIHYINAQFGEASVANPAPGVVTEQLIHHHQRGAASYQVEYQSRSSLSGGRDVLSLEEIREISCQLRAIHGHFQSRLDPDGENRWFAVDIELKLLGDDRRLLIKQARPYVFGGVDIPTDCREF